MIDSFAKSAEVRSLNRGMARSSKQVGLSLFVNPESEALQLQQKSKESPVSHELKPDGDGLYNKIVTNKKFELPTVESLPETNSFSNLSNPAIQQIRPESNLSQKMKEASPRRVSSFSRRERGSS
mmetsp:Transcript_31972/g.48942  ORF Transcript_31972/g.48942 Transcript_31972/m.48942 type:complete len:125 (+) Transcript_31972:391-765(+)